MVAELSRVLVATTRLIQFWWRKLNKSNPVDKILFGVATPPTPTPTSAGSWIDRLSGAARTPQAQASLGRRGSIMGLMTETATSFSDGCDIKRIIALQKRYVCTIP